MANHTQKILRHLEQIVEEYQHLMQKIEEGGDRPLTRYQKQLIWTSYMPEAEDLGQRLKMLIGQGEIEDADFIRAEIQELLTFLKTI